MFTGLSGLNANARNLDVIGNNIANVNTTAYKSNRMLFASQFSRNLSLGTEPSANTGGANPAQIGLGVTIAGTQRNFNTGSLAATGDQRDLAIEGDGFFVVQRGDQRFFTRAGAFRQNAVNDVVTVTGERLYGYGVDANFSLISGTLVPLNIPVGQMRLAEPTREVRFTGNLNAGGLTPTRATNIVSAPLTEITAGTPVITGASLMTDIDNPNVAGAQALFSIGQFIEINGAQKGGKVLPNARFEVTATTTVSDYLTFLNQALGIENTAPTNPDGSTPGAAVSGTGQIVIRSNIGSQNDIVLEQANIRQLTSTGGLIGSPLTTTKTLAADGESVRTTFVVYDSLGTAVSVDVTMVLDSRNSTGTTWRYFVNSADDTDLDLRVATGTIQFDTNGQRLNNLPINVTIDRVATGADTPLSFNLNFNTTGSNITALADTRSTLAATFQDGTPIGTLTSYSVGQDGVITGAFTNGQTRTVGQVALAKFSNPEGLVDIGNNLFQVGPASGVPVVAAPTTLGAGRIVGGSLEQSNVDLAGEFINLIQASTGYSASSRVISTTDQLLQQLLALGR
jgi:flagellar hook protein FlgE